jgi:hypothetical protein
MHHQPFEEPKNYYIWAILLLPFAAHCDERPKTTMAAINNEETNDNLYLLKN